MKIYLLVEQDILLSGEVFVFNESFENEDTAIYFMKKRFQELLKEEADDFYEIKHESSSEICLTDRYENIKLLQVKAINFNREIIA